MTLLADYVHHFYLFSDSNQNENQFHVSNKVQATYEA